MMELSVSRVSCYKTNISYPQIKCNSNYKNSIFAVNLAKKERLLTYDKFEKNLSVPDCNKEYSFSHIRNNINFTGYYGDQQPLKKLFWIICGRNDVYEDNWTNEHIYTAGYNKWVNADPSELLTRTPEQLIQSVCTLTKPNLHYPEIPAYIPTPNYGDKWGRYANYIEINPRIVAKYNGNEICEGLLGVMKLLPALPPSAGKGANCILLSQLYPSISNDGSIYDGSLYCSNLHEGISKNLTSPSLAGKMGTDEQVKAFNDLAHLLGFKTGFRMPLSAGQLKVHGNDFNWYDHEKAFIDACIWGIELGFDSIYFDSGKHIIDKDGYVGIGELPNDRQMTYMLNEIITWKFLYTVRQNFIP